MVGRVEHFADDVEVAAQNVVVVGLGLLDRLDSARGNTIGRTPQRLPSVRVRRLRVKQDERHAGSRGEAAHLPHIALVALLVEHQQRGVLRRACESRRAVAPWSSFRRRSRRTGRRAGRRRAEGAARGPRPGSSARSRPTLGQDRSSTSSPWERKNRRSPSARGGGGCQTHRRASSWLRSSSPAPRSETRHRRPASAPAIHSANTGTRITFTAPEPSTPQPTITPAPRIAGGYRLRTDRVVRRRIHHANATPTLANSSVRPMSMRAVRGLSIWDHLA